MVDDPNRVWPTGLTIAESRGTAQARHRRRARVLRHRTFRALAVFRLFTLAALREASHEFKVRIWTVVPPSVGLPLLIGGAAVTAIIVHVAVLTHTTWYPAYWNAPTIRSPWTPLQQPCRLLRRGPASHTRLRRPNEGRVRRRNAQSAVEALFAGDAPTSLDFAIALTSDDLPDLLTRKRTQGPGGADTPEPAARGCRGQLRDTRVQR